MAHALPLSYGSKEKASVVMGISQRLWASPKENIRIVFRFCNRKHRRATVGMGIRATLGAAIGTHGRIRTDTIGGF